MDESTNESSSDPTAAPARDGALQERSSARASVSLMAELHVGDSVEMVRVRNLSAGGLMAEFPLGLDVETEVACDLVGVGLVRGRVVWSAAGRIGIAFAQPIDPMLVSEPTDRAQA